MITTIAPPGSARFESGEAMPKKKHKIRAATVRVGVRNDFNTIYSQIRESAKAVLLKDEIEFAVINYELVFTPAPAKGTPAAVAATILDQMHTLSRLEERGEKATDFYLLTLMRIGAAAQRMDWIDIALAGIDEHKRIDKSVETRTSQYETNRGDTRRHFAALRKASPTLVKKSLRAGVRDAIADERNDHAFRLSVTSFNRYTRGLK